MIDLIYRKTRKLLLKVKDERTKRYEKNVNKREIKKRKRYEKRIKSFVNISEVSDQIMNLNVLFKSRPTNGYK